MITVELDKLITELWTMCEMGVLFGGDFVVAECSLTLDAKLSVQALWLLELICATVTILIMYQTTMIMSCYCSKAIQNSSYMEQYRNQNSNNCDVGSVRGSDEQKPYQSLEEWTLLQGKRNEKSVSSPTHPPLPISFCYFHECRISHYFPFIKHILLNCKQPVVLAQACRYYSLTYTLFD